LAAGSGNAGTMDLIERDDAFSTLRGEPDFLRLVGAGEPGDLSPTDAWIEDLDYLVERVEATHYDPWHAIAETEWRSAVEETRRRIPALSDLEIVGELARLLARVGDGHTALDPSPAGDAPGHRLPIMLYEFADGLFIRASMDPSLAGARVVSIAGVSIDELETRAAAFLSHDNDFQLIELYPRYLASLEFLQMLGVVDQGPEVGVEIEIDGESRTVTLEARPLEELIALLGDYIAEVPSFDERVEPPLLAGMRDGATAAIPLWLRSPYEPYWFTHVPERKLVYVQYNDATDREDEPFDAFVSRLFHFIDANDVRALVIDIRLNSGGSTYHSVPLVKAIVGHPRINRRGHVFTIIGRRTNSSAMRFASQLEFWTETLFVGEPSGQGPNAYGGTNVFRLPHHGKSFRVSNRYWIGGQTSDDARIWLAPDIAARLISSDYAANIDPAMDAILAWLAAAETESRHGSR
jgi:hypothetical protein